MKLNRLTPRVFVLNLYNVITQHEKLEETAGMYLPIWYYVYTKRIIIALMKRKILATFGSSKVTKPSLVYVLGHHIL